VGQCEINLKHQIAIERVQRKFTKRLSNNYCYIMCHMKSAWRH